MLRFCSRPDSLRPGGLFSRLVEAIEEGLSSRDRDDGKSLLTDSSAPRECRGRGALRVHAARKGERDARRLFYTGP